MDTQTNNSGLDRLKTFEPFVLATARRFSGDSEMRQDLCQEMRIRLWEAFNSGRICNDSYLRQACVRRAQDYLKRGKSVDSPKHRAARTPLDDSSASAEFEDYAAIIEFARKLQSRLIGANSDVASLLGRGNRPAGIAVGHGVSRQMIGHRIHEIREAAENLDHSEPHTPRRAG